MHHLAYLVVEVVVVFVMGGMFADGDGETVALGKECRVVHLGLEEEGGGPLTAVLNEVGATAYSQGVALVSRGD
jgi:hypothetical protein